MTNFEYWINEIADMPTKGEDGQWYDAETGHPYNAGIDYRTGSARAPRRTMSQTAQDARTVAKMFGGKALKGTAKQKEWAEKIRAEALRGMTIEQAEMAAEPNGLLTNSKFWIENRTRNGREIGEFVEMQKALLKQYRTAHAAGDEGKVAEIAGKYNALTEGWGF